jgi:hypothetical protein
MTSHPHSPVSRGCSLLVHTDLCSRDLIATVVEVCRAGTAVIAVVGSGSWCGFSLAGSRPTAVSHDLFIAICIACSQAGRLPPATIAFFLAGREPTRCCCCCLKRPHRLLQRIYKRLAAVFSRHSAGGLVIVTSSSAQSGGCGFLLAAH